MLAYICTSAPSPQVIHGVLSLVQPLWLGRQAYDVQLQVYIQGSAANGGSKAARWLLQGRCRHAGTGPQGCHSLPGCGQDHEQVS